MADSLRTVGGDLNLRGVAASVPVFTSLGNVAGVLRVTVNSGLYQIGATGVAHLSLGGLEVTDNTVLSRAPFAADVTVIKSGAVSFVNNPGLCPCQVDNFFLGLRTRGWSGPATNTGNGATATCIPLCPVP